MIQFILVEYLICNINQFKQVVKKLYSKKILQILVQNLKYIVGK